jgi:hypothetical protein
MINETPSVKVLGTQDTIKRDQLILEEEEALDALSAEETIQSSLASHILSVYQKNKDARQTSGIEEKLFQSFRAYNGKYDPEDIAKINETGGSRIYMNLTPTKCRATMSWIRDILLAAKEAAWSFEPSPVPDLPQEIRSQIEDQIQKIVEASTEQAQDASGAVSTIQETNQLRIDIEEALRDEIYKIAKAEVKKKEIIVLDQLVEGDWDKALSEFIEDFCVFQVAIMKGPVITKKRRLTWEGGKPVPVDDFIFLNKRVSPFDMYPSASASDIDEGDLCEHIRLHRKELYNLIGVENYKEEAIREVLANGNTGLSSFIDLGVEEEKSEEEFKGDSYRANEDVYHGIHYFGSASHECLVDWGFPESLLDGDTEKEYEVECILVGDRVIKCVINDDPLLRRPYYKASFQNIPGSWWGRSLPELMRDIQRMCNATARALSNNMGVAAGPQIEVYIDRLAADEELESIYPLKIWQVTTDPTGAGGRAVQFWQPSSNASELLAVYKEFELRADDATGVPRYAYGNERVGAAAATASGLSMLLDSASKGIKDAIRHIDDGLIKPRVEYQFYWNMISNPDLNFSGDIIVISKGSQALTMKGSQEMRRNEFLQILQNPQYQGIIGVEGMAEILREMAKGLGLGNNIIPSRIELKKKIKEEKQMQEQQMQQQAEAQNQQAAVGVQQVQMQVEQAELASQRNAQLKQQELQMKAEIEMLNQQLRAKEMELREREVVTKATAALQKQQMADAQRDKDTNKKIALELKKGENEIG